MKTVLKSLKSALTHLTVVGVLGLTLWMGSGLNSTALAANVRDYHTNVTGAEESAGRMDKDQEKVGGMNNYKDTDPRRDTAKTDAKSKALLDNSRVIRNQTDGPIDAVQSALEDAGK